jgi:hypothetical protein
MTRACPSKENDNDKKVRDRHKLLTLVDRVEGATQRQTAVNSLDTGAPERPVRRGRA